jgi:hypothetical protein
MRRNLFWVGIAVCVATGCGGGSTSPSLSSHPDASGGTPMEAGAATPDAAGVIPPEGGAADSSPVVLGDAAMPGTQLIANKVDILFSIDNSASMGDKQEYLRAAVPDLIDQLINPSCIDPTTNAVVGVSSGGTCAQGQLAFAPVHDMHLGIVSSALGARLGDACSPQAMALAPFSNLLAHNDDQAHLLNRTLTYTDDGGAATEGTLADASPAPDLFLYWYPTVGNTAPAGPGTPVTSSATLEGDFADLVGGAGVFGCGIESQLESWYRFLIQPDPYLTLVSMNGLAAWSGVDSVILQERHDFLRPDSLVSIIVLSDENDSEIDVRSLGQQGFNWMSTAFAPPRGTAACGVDGVGGNPADPSCESCAQLSTAAQQADSNCMMGTYPDTAINDWAYDLNLRHVHMKAKYGLDPQFPIQRYVNGLTSATVPDRDGEYPAGASSYVGTNDCNNPLFAASLPDGSATDAPTLCNLQPGARSPSLVFYTHIGGVPYQLLHFAPGDVNASALTEADWVNILGTDPLNYDYTGIDPHMIESFTPRANVSPPGSANNADPINGHDWVTNTGTGHILNVDREYACVFPLVDMNGNPTTRDCTLAQNQNFCDCPHTPTGSLTADQLPPICDPTTQSNQVGAKAYPTIRELELAHLMGTQGIVSSICPQHVTEESPGDPLYGYRPGISLLVSHLAPAIGKPPQ